MKGVISKVPFRAVVFLWNAWSRRPCFSLLVLMLYVNASCHVLSPRLRCVSRPADLVQHFICTLQLHSCFIITFLLCDSYLSCRLVYRCFACLQISADCITWLYAANLSILFECKLLALNILISFRSKGRSCPFTETVL